MKIKLSQLRKLINEVIFNENNRRVLANEHFLIDEQDILNKVFNEEDLDEVDTDPTNNPGRPNDPYDYLGMHPSPTAAMSHPSAGGSSGTVPVESPDNIED